MMEITLEGVAGKRFGRKHRLAVRNPNEAIRSLCQLIPGFREFLTSAHEHGIFFQVKTERKGSANYDELGLGCKSFTLVPVITGALNFSARNIGLIVIGLVLVALAIPGFIITYGAAGTVSAAVQTAVMSLGFALVFTGIAGLFGPGLPTDGKQEGSEANDAVFSGGKATADAGTPIPLLYGEYLASNMPVVSSYIDDNEGHLLCIISEGAIEGMPNGSGTDLYFNGLQSASSSVSEIQFTDGTQTTKQINIVKSAGFHLGVGATLGKSEPGDPNPQIVRSFAQVDGDTLKIRILRGPCYQIRQSSKNTGGAPSTKYREYDATPHDSVDLPSEGEEYLRWNLRVTDNDGNVLYNREVRDRGPLKASKLYKPLPEIDISGAAVPVVIQLTRLDKGEIPDPESHKGGANTYSFSWVKGDIQFVSADVSWSEKLIYPGTALLGVKFNVGEFTQMPTVQGLFRGIKVPTLNSSLTVSYAWSDNPAYILLDLLTNPRYGLGRREYTTTGPDPVDRVTPGISIHDIDLASFKVAADYCDERVGNGKRFTFNGYINRNSDALDLIRSVASSFNASLIYAGGFVTLVLDRKSDVSDFTGYRLYSEANTIQETDDSGEVTTPCFNYEGTARKARTTAVEVSFINPNEFYAENKEVVEDAESIERYGYNQQTVRALGCTSREQARRLGRYVLASNTLCTETVSFKVGTEGAMLLPGDICLIADPLKTRITSGGRISQATSNQVFTDRSITGFTAGGDWYLYTYGNSGIAQRNKVTGRNYGAGLQGTTVINIEGSFTSIPTSSQMWILVDESQENSFRRYRVQSVKEDGDGTYQVIGILYTDRKFDFIDTGAIDYGKSTKTYYKSRNPAISKNKITFGIRNLS